MGKNYTCNSERALRQYLKDYTYTGLIYYINKFVITNNIFDL